MSGVVTAYDESLEYYQVLGVDQEASEKQIKRAFHKLSLKYHPDKKGPDSHKQKYLAITEAYEILSDAEKRSIYDTEGHEGLKQAAQGGGGGGSPFDMFFGGGGGGGGRRKGPDFKMDFPVTLEDLYNGLERDFKVNRKVLCKKCRGTGAEGGATVKCRKCKGAGVITRMQQLGPGFNVQMQDHCDKCGGKGKTAKKLCPHCRGTKTVDEDKELNAVVEQGMDTGSELRFERASEQRPGTTPGDVILVLKTQPHPRFKRLKDDLHYTMTITLKQALLGFTKTIEHLDGHTVEITKDTVTQHGSFHKVPGEGMPQHEFPSNKGTLVVKFEVMLPPKLTEDQSKLIGSLF
eukprot:CAMPEP_0175152538 /NCGR_PEP_ID=MMETSP0087-20121206/19174_1 /TAXON_ID=136419 /ORGANISM="Unknown Unknown, Strain D1" /LENGTH=347 /DNA_ID=CAMNT_0016438991 /DNA_START=93 /DNA_END=1136 /DNA_ORIENTATION=+